jgi:hypothetical protein
MIVLAACAAACPCGASQVDVACAALRQATPHQLELAWSHPAAAEYWLATTGREIQVGRCSGCVPVAVDRCCAATMAVPHWAIGFG